MTASMYLHCDIKRHLQVQTWFVYVPLSVQPLFSNFVIGRGRHSTEEAFLLPTQQPQVQILALPCFFSLYC